MDQVFASLPDVTKQRLLTEAALRKFNPAPAERFESAAEFNAHDEPPLTFLVDGLLARGQLAMLGGRSKSGKSWLVAQLAQSFDTGQPFLGRAVSPARVLYMALEDKRKRLKRRTQSLGWVPATTTFEYRIPRFNGPNGQFGPGLELIERIAWDFDVILIDTLIATLDGTISENDNTSMGAIANELATLAHDMDCAILLVHHINKGMSDDVFNLLRGASALRGAYDVGLMLDRRQGEREAVLHVESRDFEAAGLTIRQREGGRGWDLVGEAREIARIRVGRKVIEAIEELGGRVTVDELAEHLQISRQAVGQQLKLAQQEGDLVRTAGVVEGKGKGRPRDLWSLKELAPVEDGINQAPGPAGGSSQNALF
jgi:hypothetical protein